MVRLQQCKLHKHAVGYVLLPIKLSHLSGLEQHTFIILQFQWVQSVGRVQLGSYETAIKPSVRVGVSSEARLGKNLLMYLLAEIIFLQAVGQKLPSVSCHVAGVHKLYQVQL